MPVFGFSHLAALAVAGLGALWFIRIGRRTRWSGRELGWLLLVAQAIDPLIAWHEGYLDIEYSLPLELCDAAAFAAIVALWTRQQLAFELTYFWGLSGTLQALLTPAPGFWFPHPDAFRYFVLHSGIVWAALFLGPGCGMRPRRGAAGKAFGWTAVYAGCLAVVNLLTGGNYMFLRRKPPGSILEVFGPWPNYLFAGAGIGLFLFWLLELPWELSRSRRTSARPRGGAGRGSS